VRGGRAGSVVDGARFEGSRSRLAPRTEARLDSSRWAINSTAEGRCCQARWR
jgi:hypothetical protein